MRPPPRKSLSEIDHSNLTAIRLTAKQKQYMAEGVALFNEGKYWHAHEAWEKIWLEHAEDGRVFFQGLIQLAAAFHQLKRDIVRGFVIHLNQAKEKLILFPSRFQGVDLRSLISAIDSNLLLISQENGLDGIDLSRVVIPRILFGRKKQSPSKAAKSNYRTGD